MIDTFQDLEEALFQISSYVAKEEGKREKLIEQIDDNKEQLKAIHEEIDLMEKVGLLLQETAEFARDQAKDQIETLVTNCIQYIFENNAEFKIEIEELYGKPSAEFYVITQVDDTVIKTKPEQSRGGGVIDIISLALRIAFLHAYEPKIEGPLILDEPAKHVSEDYIFNVADFLKRTSEMFRRQIIMVTHNDHLASIATRAYRVSLKGSISHLEQITSTNLLDISGQK
ncbi:MAG: ATPase [Tissierellia bacterium]|nr:ATPase [Tissierellia bacterium]